MWYLYAPLSAQRSGMNSSETGECWRTEERVYNTFTHDAYVNIYSMEWLWIPPTPSTAHSLHTAAHNQHLGMLQHTILGLSLHVCCHVSLFWYLSCLLPGHVLFPVSHRLPCAFNHFVLMQMVRDYAQCFVPVIYQALALCVWCSRYLLCLVPWFLHFSFCVRYATCRQPKTLVWNSEGKRVRLFGIDKIRPSLPLNPSFFEILMMSSIFWSEVQFLIQQHMMPPTTCF